MMKMTAMMTVLEKPFKNEFNKNPSLTLNDPEEFPILTGLKSTLLAPSSGQPVFPKILLLAKQPLHSFPLKTQTVNLKSQRVHFLSLNIILL